MNTKKSPQSHVLYNINHISAAGEHYSSYNGCLNPGSIAPNHGSPPDTISWEHIFKPFEFSRYPGSLAPIYGSPPDAGSIDPNHGSPPDLGSIAPLHRSPPDPW